MQISTEIIGHFECYGIKVRKSQADEDDCEIIYLAEDGTEGDRLTLLCEDINDLITLLQRFGEDNGHVPPVAILSTPIGPITRKPSPKGAAIKERDML